MWQCKALAETLENAGKLKDWMVLRAQCCTLSLVYSKTILYRQIIIQVKRLRKEGILTSWKREEQRKCENGKGNDIPKTKREQSEGQETTENEGKGAKDKRGSKKEAKQTKTTKTQRTQQKGKQNKGKLSLQRFTQQIRAIPLMQQTMFAPTNPSWAGIVIHDSCVDEVEDADEIALAIE